MVLEQAAAAPQDGRAVPTPSGRVVPLSPAPPTYDAAVERYLTGAGIAKSSARSTGSHSRHGGLLRGEQSPTGPARRGARPDPFVLAALADPGLPPVLAELAAARADALDADTVNRELSIAREAIGWWHAQGWIAGDPALGIERRPPSADRTRALARSQVAALWRLDAPLRDKTLWKLLYESAARADEVLCLTSKTFSPATNAAAPPPKATPSSGSTGNPAPRNSCRA